MPLDQRELMRQIEAKAPALRVNLSTLQSNLTTTTEVYRRADNLRLAAQIKQSKTHRSIGQPVDGNIQEMVPIDAPPEDYTIVATDSSPIAPDRHGGMAAYYVINVGQVMLRYGANSTATITTKLEFGGGLSDEEENIALSGDLLSAKSAVAELEQGLTFGLHHRSDLVLHDGPLTLWNAANTGGESERLNKRYYELLNEYQKANLPVVGYVSNPHSESVINGLRTLKCDKEFPHCGRNAKKGGEICHPNNATACQDLRGLMDAQLFGGVLPMGHRSPIFKAILREPRQLAAHIDEIYFVYLKTGYEVIRLEFPAWLKQQPRLLEQALALVLDQSVRGDGYPPVLMEAHESAVLRGDDRTLLRILLEDHQLLQPESEKGRSKRIRGL